MTHRFRALQELGDQFQHLSQQTTKGDAPSPDAGWRSHRPDAPTRRSSVWAAIGVVGGVVAAAAVVVVLLLSTGTPPAYARWAAVPTAAKRAAVTRAITNCYKVGPHKTGLGHPVLSETRGVSTGVVYVIGGTVYMCLDDSKGTNVASNSMGPVSTAPGPTQLGIPYATYGGSGSGRLPEALVKAMRQRPISQTTWRKVAQYRAGDGYGYWALGQAGSQIRGVTFSFAGRQPVTATVEHGWYFAWWPWESDPTSVTVTTHAGTVKSPMKNAWPGQNGSRPYPACQPGTVGCVFAARHPTAVRVARPGSALQWVAQQCRAAALTSDTLPADAFAKRPLMTVRRGISTALVSEAGHQVYTCLIQGSQKNHKLPFSEHVGAFGPVRAAPAPGTISAPYTERQGMGSGRSVGARRASNTPATRQAYITRLTGGGYGPYAFGQVGNNVRDVTFNLADGHDARATIRHDWYFAWWPWISNARSVTVTTSSGTFTSRVRPASSPRGPIRPACRPGSHSCAFGT